MKPCEKDMYVLLYSACRQVKVFCYLCVRIDSFENQLDDLRFSRAESVLIFDLFELFLRKLHRYINLCLYGNICQEQYFHSE